MRYLDASKDILIDMMKIKMSSVLTFTVRMPISNDRQKKNFSPQGWPKTTKTSITTIDGEEECVQFSFLVRNSISEYQFFASIFW